MSLLAQLHLFTDSLTFYCFTSQSHRKKEIKFPGLITGDFTSFNSELTFTEKSIIIITRLL